MKSFLSFLVALAIFMSILPSCNKNPDNPTPPIFDSATIMGFKDSTQLVKTVSIVYYDTSGDISDSIPTLFLYYDTINKKVYFTMQPHTSLPINNYFFELSYNNDGLVKHITYNSGSGDPTDVSAVDYVYDDQDVIKSETATFANGSTLINSFNKSSLSSGGYSLRFKGLGDVNPFTDSSLYTQNFDANGSLISVSEFYLPSLNSGYKDSLVYDAAGNVSRVIYTHFEDNGNSNSTTFLEFNSRDTKGDQLYILNKVLFNGIADLPNAGFVSLGSFLSGNGNIFFYQFVKHPSLSTKVNLGDPNSSLTFNPAPQYDSKNRLVKYKMFNGEDPDYYVEYNLSYYK